MATKLTRTRLRRALVAASCGCRLQHDGWPCGTCFYTIDGMTQADWHAVLAYRGDTTPEPDGAYKMPTEIVFDQDGAFDRHEFVTIPAAEILRRVEVLWRRLRGPVQ